ncbi:MAG: Ig-like domain-containing protein [Lachnospiraceae bacterium]|nr:Ig-like domain-containing protein [Lachnospiraceae bacterium]
MKKRMKTRISVWLVAAMVISQPMSVTAQELIPETGIAEAYVEEDISGQADMPETDELSALDDISEPDGIQDLESLSYTEPVTPIENIEPDKDSEPESVSEYNDENLQGSSQEDLLAAQEALRQLGGLIETGGNPAEVAGWVISEAIPDLLSLAFGSKGQPTTQDIMNKLDEVVKNQDEMMGKLANLDKVLHAEELAGQLNTFAKIDPGNGYRTLRNIDNNKDLSAKDKADRRNKALIYDMVETNNEQTKYVSGAECNMDKNVYALGEMLTGPIHMSSMDSENLFEVIHMWCKYKYHWEHQAYDEWLAMRNAVYARYATMSTVDYMSLCSRIEYLSANNLTYDTLETARIDLKDQMAKVKKAYDDSAVSIRDDSVRFYQYPKHELLLYKTAKKQVIPQEARTAGLRPGRKKYVYVTKPKGISKGKNGWEPVYGFWSQFLYYDNSNNIKVPTLDWFKSVARDDYQGSKNLYDILKEGGIEMPSGSNSNWEYMVYQDGKNAKLDYCTHWYKGDRLTVTIADSNGNADKSGDSGTGVNFYIYHDEYNELDDNYKKGTNIIGIGIAPDKQNSIKAETAVYKHEENEPVTWTKGSLSECNIRLNRTADNGSAMRYFEGIEVDGKLINEANYTRGSIATVSGNETVSGDKMYVGLNADFLDSLSVGDHVLTAVFSDGDDPSVSLTVREGQADFKLYTKAGSKLTECTFNRLQAGKAFALTAGYADGHAFDAQDLVWTSTDTNVAAVTCDGRVTAICEGTAVIKATINENGGQALTATCTVEVTQEAVTNPVVVNDFVIKSVGGTDKLAAGSSLSIRTFSADGKAVNIPVNWSVKNKADTGRAHAQINARGILTGSSEGCVTVTAVSTADPTKTASVDIQIYVPIRSVRLNMTSATISRSLSGNGLKLETYITPGIEGAVATGITPGTGPSIRYEVGSGYEDKLSVNALTGVINVKDQAVPTRKIPVNAIVEAYNGYKKTFSCFVDIVDDKPIKAIKLSSAALILGVGDLNSLGVIFDPVYPDGDNGVTWESSDTGIVTVDDKGVLTGIKAGAAIVTATAKAADKKGNHPKAFCKIKVVPSVKSVRFADTEGLVDKGLAVGGKYAVKYEIEQNGEGKLPGNAITWKSSDRSIAVVSNSGVIKAVSPTAKGGKVTITAEGSGCKASVSFTVYAPLKKINTDRKKITIGTSEGTKYGRINMTPIPAEASMVPVRWTSDEDIVTLAAVHKNMRPETASFDESATVGPDQYLAIEANAPGVTKLTGISADGKKLTCLVTVRGQISDLRLTTDAGKNGYSDVTPSDTEGKYTGKVKAGSKLNLKPVIEINGVSSDTEYISWKRIYAGYSKYTDTSLTYISSDKGIATVSKSGSISVAKSASPGSKAIIIVGSCDGKHRVEIELTVAE